MFPLLGLGFTAKHATTTSRMKRSSRSANAKTVSNHSCLWSSLHYWKWEWSLIHTYLLMLVENLPVMSRCLSLYVLLSSSEFIFSLIFYYLATFSLSGLAVSKVAFFYWCILNIYVYVYLKWWLPDWSHVCFLWLIALLHHWSALIGWFVDWELFCVHRSALILFLSLIHVVAPLASQILCTCPPDLPFFLWFALVKQAHICLFVAWFCWFMILEQHLFAQ